MFWNEGLGDRVCTTTWVAWEDSLKVELFIIPLIETCLVTLWEESLEVELFITPPIETGLVTCPGNPVIEICLGVGGSGLRSSTIGDVLPTACGASTVRELRYGVAAIPCCAPPDDIRSKDETEPVWDAQLFGPRRSVWRAEIGCDVIEVEEVDDSDSFRSFTLICGGDRVRTSTPC